MKYRNLRNHTLAILMEDGRSSVIRKHSNAFAVCMNTGEDVIPLANDRVIPISKQEAHQALLPMDEKYL